MAQKYKLEEFHDPDYNAQQYTHSDKNHANQQQQQQKSDLISNHLETTDKYELLNQPCASTSTPNQLSTEERHKKICDVIKREFGQAIAAKKSEVDEITKRINEAKELLAKVRYAVVYNYYSKKNLSYSETEFKEILKNNTRDGSSSSVDTTGMDLEKFQPAIHPSLKKLIGERKVDYDEILKARPRRQAAKTATQRFNKKEKEVEPIKLKEEQQIQVNKMDDAADTKNEIKLPRYVPPQIPNKQIAQLNSARGRSHYRHLIVVGNTSKYIGHEEIGTMTNVTHKWLVYVSTKTSVPVDNILTKVRFFLHESYKPNDVMEVSSPPFELSRRGWGEFPIRVQLYFQPHLLQKPVQIYHNLVLDKKNTGLQTMGAETTVELWLNIPNKEAMENPSPNKNELDMCSESKAIVNTVAKALVESEKSSEIKPKLVNHEAEYIKSTIVTNNETSTNTKQLINLPPTPFVTQTADTKIVPIQRIVNNQQAPEKPAIMSTNNSLVTFSNMPNKKFMKCIDKQGKVSFVELLPDPNNPKVFKLVLPNNKLTPLGTNSIRPMPALSPIQTAATKPIPPLVTTSLTVRPPALNVPINSMNNKGVPIVNAAIKQTSQPPQLFTPTNNAGTMKLHTSNNLNVNTIPKVVNKNPVNTIKRPAETPLAQIQQNTPLSNVHDKAVIMKNGKIFIVDKSKAIVQPKLQQSLLKPQVSLLKPAIAENNQQLQVPCPPLSLSNQLNIRLSNEKSVFKKISKSATQNEPFATSSAIGKNVLSIKVNPRQHAIDLEERFYKCDHFKHVTDSVYWLLRRLPLIMKQEIHGLRDSFPFMARNEQTYYSMHWGKQRCYEMMRARYIKQLIAKHTSVSKFKPEWTTRQIIVFARKFGFTPALHPNPSTEETKSNPSTYKDVIKNELIKEHLQNDTISFNHRIKEWLDVAEAKLLKIRKENVSVADDILDTEIIDVDDLSDTTSSSTKMKYLDCKEEYSNKLVLPVENNLQNEFSWIRDLCRGLQIKIQPEELVEGVMYRAADRVVISALRSFTEDLLRRARFNKTMNSTAEHHNDITREDILNAITNTKHFDFMTNKLLGIEKAVPQS